MTEQNDNLKDLLRATSAVVTKTLDVQNEIKRGLRDLNRIDDLREELEELWRELDRIDRERFREEHKDDPFPKSPETVGVTTPFPPTLNHNVARRGNRYYRDKNYDAFIEYVGYEWRRVRPRTWNANCRYAVSISLFYDSNRRYDVDNRVKPVLDALTKAGVWQDDSQVDDVRVVRCGIDKANPRSEVAIIPLEAEEEPEQPKRRRRAKP